MFHHNHVPIGLLTLLLAPTVALPPACGQQGSDEGGWIEERDQEATGRTVRTMHMTVHPKGEPRPALKYRLIPDEFEMVDGNAATFYLGAMGFLEQQPAHDRLSQFLAEAREKADRERRGMTEVPPYTWLSMAPEELPIDEVKDYLRLLSFQERYMAEAVRRRHFDLDRNLRDIDNPIGFLLPEVQTMRELARNQSLRFKVAIAEGRTDDALAILGQQYAMARHLGQDEFAISGLVGSAVARIAWNDALQFVQYPDAPNLYWAIASLPDPLLDVRRALVVEHHLFYLQFKPLREVDERVRPAGYWQDLIDRLIPTLRGLEEESGLPALPEDPEQARAVMAAMIAAAYPEAKRYLIEEWGMPSDRVEAYPTAQVVLLALVRDVDVASDARFKWNYVRPWQAREQRKAEDGVDQKRVESGRLGWIAEMPHALIPAISFTEAFARHQQELALLQTVEAIRMYAANHEGQLPASLDDLPVPAAIDPATGQPLDYEVRGGEAVLTGQFLANIRSRLIVRIADAATES